MSKGLNKAVFVLSDEEVKIISKNWEPLDFSKEFSLFYKGQVPNGGFLLIEGEVVLDKMKGKEVILGPPTLLGFYHLLNNLPMKFNALIQPNSKICFIDKTLLDEKMKSDVTIANVFQKYLKE